MSNFEKVTSLFLILIGLSEFLTHTLTPSFIVLNKKKFHPVMSRAQKEEKNSKLHVVRETNSLGFLEGESKQESL